MRTKDQLSRAIRLTKIQHYLYRNPSGATSQELASLCEVTLRTIQRDLASLESDLGIPLLKKPYDRYAIMDGYVLPPISFTLYEALAVFLASRLVLKQSDESNPHISSALAKLSGLLPASLAETMQRSLEMLANKPDKPEYLAVYEKLAIGWVTKRKLAITYSSLRSGETNEWLLEPYYIEMTGVGCSTYVIGRAVKEGYDGIYTFKLDRIKEAELLEANFEIPSNFDLDRLLVGAWGIVWGEEMTIKLKFSAGVCRRLKETRWHASQEIANFPDGSCLMTLKVGSTLELTPWIRSWGPDVEVIEPPSLRDQFRDWSEIFYRLYHE